MTWRPLELNAVCILSRSSNFQRILKSLCLPETWIPLGIFSRFEFFSVSASVLSEWNYGPIWFLWPPPAGFWSFQQASLCPSNFPICHCLPPRSTQHGVGGGSVQEEGLTRDFPGNFKPALCLKAICVTPPLEKGKPHLEVIYLVIAHYLQLISRRAS